MRGRAWVLGSLLAALSAHPALAQGEVSECEAFPSSLEGLAVMRVAGSGPAHFFETWVDGCERSAEHCRKRAYVLPGDRVFAKPAGQGFSCAWYLDGKGRETWGLLYARELVAEPVDRAAWAGRWRRGDHERAGSAEAEITIVPEGGGLKAGGDLTNPYRDGAGGLSAHVGSFGGGADDQKAMFNNGRLTIAEDECRLGMLQLGDLLLVIDNGTCPVPSASFSGFYRRVTRTSKH